MKPFAVIKRRFVIAGLLGLLPALGVFGSLPASAADGSSSVTCATGDSCVIQLDQMVKFGGANYSASASNMVINITPPPCMWNPIGNAQTGSQYIIGSYGGTPPAAGQPVRPEPDLPAGQAAAGHDAHTGRRVVLPAGPPG